jgi:hypothetical protein
VAAEEGALAPPPERIPPSAEHVDGMCREVLAGAALAGEQDAAGRAGHDSPEVMFPRFAGGGSGGNAHGKPSRHASQPRHKP